MNIPSSQPGSPQKKRISQDERSAVTRNKLLDATFRILEELGHAGLRSANISTESGVSRGGLLHHYATKELLVAALLERMLERMEEESWNRIKSVPDDAVLPALVDDARSRFFGSSFKVQLDILVASGSEKPIVNVLKSLTGGDQVLARDGWALRLESTGVERKTARQTTSFLWNLVKGLGLRNLVNPDYKLDDRAIALALDLAHRRCYVKGTSL